LRWSKANLSMVEKRTWSSEVCNRVKSARWRSNISSQFRSIDESSILGSRWSRNWSRLHWLIRWVWLLVSDWIHPWPWKSSHMIFSSLFRFVGVFSNCRNFKGSMLFLLSKKWISWDCREGISWLSNTLWLVMKSSWPDTHWAHYIVIWALLPCSKVGDLGHCIHSLKVLLRKSRLSNCSSSLRDQVLLLSSHLFSNCLSIEGLHLVHSIPLSDVNLLT